MRRTPFALGLLLLASFARPARAEDAEDPARLLRRARTTESADRDVAAALPLYRKVMALAPGSDAARDAGLRLLELLEIRGERTAALEVAALLTERLSTRLDDAGKRKVHEAMARMLPAGSKARSPLGEIYVVPPASATSGAASPLEAKVLALLQRVDAADPANQPLAGVAVLRDVKLIGSDAVAPLAKILQTERFDHARFAALALAQIGTPEAIEVLVTSAREGDGFARTAALAGLYALAPSPAASPACVKAVAPLLDDPALAGSRVLLRDILAVHADDAEVTRRMAAGGPDGSYWLHIALKRGLPAARDELERATADERAIDDPLVAAFQRVAGARPVSSGGAGPVVHLVPGLPPTTRLAALRLLVAAPPTAYRLQVAADIAVACVHAGDADVAAKAAALAWPYVLRAPDTLGPAGGVDLLVVGAVPVPKDVVDDDVRVERLLRTWVLAGESQGPTPSYMLDVLAAPALVARPVFAITLARIAREFATGKPGAARMRDLLTRLDPAKLPPEAAAAWRDALPTFGTREFAPPGGFGAFAFRVACAASDPRALDAVRRVEPKEYVILERMVAEVNERYAGDDRAALAVDLLVPLWIGNTAARHSLLDAAIRAPRFYAALADRLDADLDAGLAAMRMLPQTLRFEIVSPAPATAWAERWLSVLRRIGPPRSRESQASPAWVLARWAVAGNAPATLALARARALGGAPPEGNAVVVEALVNAIASTAGIPGARAFLVELSRRADLSDDVASSVVGGLARPGDDGDLPRVEEIAASRTAPGARAAVAVLATGRHHDALVRIVVPLAGKTVPATPWARTLHDAVRTLRLREAIPWLLAEAKDGDPDAADAFAKTIDAIHAHHERIAKFDALGTAARDARAEIEPLLAEADPELRSAAIVSYGAIAGRDGLPRLLRLAKEEKDAAVRASILETIDRIAKAPIPPPALPVTPPKSTD